MTRGIIIHREYGPVGTASASTFDPYQWPDGQQYIDVLTKEGVLPFPTEGRDNEAGAAEASQASPTSPSSSYWQAAARWALLSKYGVLFGGGSDAGGGTTTDASLVLREIAYMAFGAKRRLVLSDEAVREISRRWKEVVDDALATTYSSSSDTTSDTASTIPWELLEFVRTGLSHGRPMQWTILECPAGLQFPVHAHPNFELVYNLRGDLHEVRMKGDPLPMELPPPPPPAVSSPSNEKPVVKGPSLTRISRPWYFGTVREGEWLVNEVGSVHKTFTASKGDGCLLLVVWGGSNANIDAADEPRTPNVQAAVDRMDERICSCGSDRWEEIQETFLPESERSANVSGE
jgi:hypothetical protein